MLKTTEAAIGKWPGILRELGVPATFLRNKHGPCPFCEGRDRWRFDDKQGCGTWYCNGCGAGDGIQFAMRWTGLPFAECAKRIDSIVGNVDTTPIKSKSDPLPALRRMQDALVPMDGINPVRLYLKSRGLSPAPATRFCPSWRYWDDGNVIGRFPAMVHQIQSPEGQPLTWHVTYLTPKGEKAPVPAQRKVMPAAGELSGGAIRLYPAGETLGIAEGIETAMAAHKLTSLPVWAAYSANLLSQWNPPESVKHVVVFGDNDASYTGQWAAFTLAKRLVSQGFSVTVEIPNREGTDFADEVQA